jgi:hypothetical protein
MRNAGCAVPGIALSVAVALRSFNHPSMLILDRIHVSGFRVTVTGCQVKLPSPQDHDVPVKVEFHRDSS